MRFKTLIARCMWAAFGLVLLVCGYAGISQNADSIAKWIAPTYAGLSEEEIFKRSNIPCVRQVGKKNGCSYPEAETPALTGDEWRDRDNAKLAELKNFKEVMAIQGPEYRHYEEYFEREIIPRRDRLVLWTGILFGLAAVGVGMYLLGSVRAWSVTSAAADFARVKRKFVRPSWILAVKSILASRKLRRLDSDFKALHNLHQNGLISDEDFDQRKQALRATINIG